MRTKVTKIIKETNIMASKFNKSEVMRIAHRSYKYRGKKQGKTFAEVLKATWMIAKIHVQMAEVAAKREAEAEARAMMFRNSKPAEVIRDNLTYEDVYGTFRSGRYVGD